MKKAISFVMLLIVGTLLIITVKTGMITETRAENNITSVVENFRPRRLLIMSVIQNEPKYIPSPVIATEPPEYNMEKFSNPGGISMPCTSSVSSIPQQQQSPPAGALTKSKGVNQGPSGKETWYNLPMAGVVKIMRVQGYTEEEYPYWIRDDGCKMLGNYIMIAANLELRPRGTIVETSLGAGIVCDTGSFANKNNTAIDIATNW